MSKYWILSQVPSNNDQTLVVKRRSSPPSKSRRWCLMTPSGCWHRIVRTNLESNSHLVTACPSRMCPKLRQQGLKSITDFLRKLPLWSMSFSIFLFFLVLSFFSLYFLRVQASLLSAARSFYIFLSSPSEERHIMSVSQKYLFSIVKIVRIHPYCQQWNPSHMLLLLKKSHFFHLAITCDAVYKIQSAEIRISVFASPNTHNHHEIVNRPGLPRAPPSPRLSLCHFFWQRQSAFV